MIRTLLTLLLLCISATAQVAPFALSSYKTTGSMMGGWTPTNIVGMTYFWDFMDLPFDTNVSSWVDKINGVQFGQTNVSNMPTNTIYGVKFGTPSGIVLTNAGVVFPTNSTMWIVYDNSGGTTGSTGTLIGDHARNNNFCIRTSNKLAMFAGGSLQALFTGNMATTTTNGEEYWKMAFVYAAGKVYTNGIFCTNGFITTASMTLTDMGNDTSSDKFPGRIQYIGIWTNKVLNQTEITALKDWVRTVRALSITNGLVNYWKADENTGTTLIDSVGGNNAIFQGLTGEYWTNGNIRAGVWYSNTLPGLSNYTEVTNSGSVADNLANMTVSCWIKTIDTNAFTFGDPRGIVTKHSDFLYNDSRYPGWEIKMDDGSMACSVTDGTHYLQGQYSAVAGLYGINDGQWHFLAFAKDNTGTNLLQWLDGLSFTGYTASNGPVGSISTTNYIRFAWNYRSTKGNFDYTYFPGIIDDIRIYNRVLSYSEIISNYYWGYYVKQ